MATSEATPPDDPHGTPGEPESARTESPDTTAPAGVIYPGDIVGRTMVEISAIIDPLIDNEKVIAAGFAERTRLLAELDRLGHCPHIIAGLRGDPVESGANDPDTLTHGPAWDDEELARRTLAAEVGGALRLNVNTAGLMIFDAARLLEQLPGFHAALARGTISWGHVVKMQMLTAGAPDEVLPRLEAEVLPAAEKFTATQFGRVAARVLNRLHPVSLQERVDVGAAKRRVQLHPDVDGMAWLNAYLKAEEAQAVYGRLTSIAKNLNDADTNAVPDAPDATDATDATNATEAPVLRTMDQRRADAYRDLLLDGECVGGLGRGIRGTVHVTVPVLTLLGKSTEPGMLEGYGPIDPETARQLAGTAKSWDRILTHPETGCMLSVGHDSYAPPADMRRYLQIRDQTCQGIGCNKKATTSEIDHTQAWNAGGTTSTDNLVHLCRACHRLKHQSSFRTSQTPQGELTWTSPGGKKYTKQPANSIGRPAEAAQPAKSTQDVSPTDEAHPTSLPTPTGQPESDGPPPF